jgi:hypothetical protein
MDKIDIINKYRTSIDKNRIENIWNDIYSVNKVVRYNCSVGVIVDLICMNVVRMMELENNFRSIKYDLDKLQNLNREVRLSGIEELKRENRLVQYIKTLDKDEKQLLISLDLGVHDIISEIDLIEFKERQNSSSRHYSMTNK